MKDKLVSESRTIMTELIMPNDTNPLGNMMGGNLMRLMDIGAGICAGKHSEAHVVTASVDHVSFQVPIPMGSVITLTSTVTRAFNTSMEVYTEVHVADITGANTRKSNHSYMTFVALNEKDKKPCKVPVLRPVSAEEQKLFEGAVRRRELRLILSGRIEPKDAIQMKNLFRET